MGIRSRLVRMSAAVFLLVFVTGSMLMLQPVAGVSAEPPALRARVSGLLDLALNSDGAGGGAPNTRLSNFRAGSDECNVERGGTTIRSNPRSHHAGDHA